MRLFIVASIGTRLSDARNKAGISQGELGKRVGTTQQQIANIESGKTQHSKYFNPICEELGISYNWLVNGDKDLPVAQSDNPEAVIEVAMESLTRALNSVKAINLKSGNDPKLMNEDLIIRAFEISLRGALSGDYVTSALELQEIKRA